MAMTLGYIGLGKMGFNMCERLIERGYELVVFDKDAEAIAKLEKLGAKGAASAAGVANALTPRRAIWVMVPHAVVDIVLAELMPALTEGDIVIDGGNSNYKESMRRAAELAAKGIRYLDVGTSGGPGGARKGTCVLMVGGDKSAFDEMEPLFKAISLPDGEAYIGKAGAGHFIKMVHNGIEYGMMQAIGEGFELMKKQKDFKLDLLKVAQLYNRGSIVTSSLIGWLADAYTTYGEDLEAVSGEIGHTGEGEWTAIAGKENGVPMPIIEGSFQFRIQSKGNPSYTGQVVSALRNMFGGHSVKK